MSVGNLKDQDNKGNNFPWHDSLIENVADESNPITFSGTVYTLHNSYDISY